MYLHQCPNELIAVTFQCNLTTTTVYVSFHATEVTADMDKVWNALTPHTVMCQYSSSRYVIFGFRLSIKSVRHQYTVLSYQNVRLIRADLIWAGAYCALMGRKTTNSKTRTQWSSSAILSINSLKKSSTSHFDRCFVSQATWINKKWMGGKNQELTMMLFAKAVDMAF